MTIAANGYANIENYINSLTAGNRPVYLRTPLFLATTASTDKTITLGWSNYTEAADGFILEQKDGDGYKEVARAAADAESCTVDGLTAGTAYSFRLAPTRATPTLNMPSLTPRHNPKKLTW